MGECNDSGIAEMHTANETKDNKEVAEVGEWFEGEENVKTWRQLRGCQDDGLENDRR